MELGKVGIWTTELDRLPAVQLRDALQEIEGIGIRTLWVGESARRREAFTNSALILSSTEHLIVANGVASIWARDASATASAQRVLAEAFPYRFILGLGVSHEGLVSARGHVYEKPIDSMREYLRGIDSHPAGDLPDPPEPPPRDHAQGAHPFLVPPEHTHMAREILGPGRILAPEQGVLLEEDPSTARGILRSEMKTRLALPNYRKSLVRLGWSDKDFEGNGSDALIDRLFAWGSLSKIAERVNEHLAAGADHVALHVLHGPANVPPMEEWRELAALV